MSKITIKAVRPSEISHSISFIFTHEIKLDGIQIGYICYRLNNPRIIKIRLKVITKDKNWIYNWITLDEDFSSTEEAEQFINNSEFKKKFNFKKRQKFKKETKENINLKCSIKSMECNKEGIDLTLYINPEIYSNIKLLNQLTELFGKDDIEIIIKQ